MKLIIGNKNYSSWSLRPWLALRQAGIAFEEERISFNDRTWKAKVATKLVPAKVPVLIDDGEVIWDSLAILEYLAERFPEKELWPTERKARAVARSACAEMHSSFPALRRSMPMNVTARFPGLGWNVAVQADIDRISSLWTECRGRFGSAGPFLFGRFTNADAMFSPMVLRFMTHAVELSPIVTAYCEVVRSTTALKEWMAQAAEENDFVAVDEPYRVQA
jgi:glutathione S-transferase